MKANSILIKAKKQVYGDLMGNNRSKFLADGFDFAELRAYNNEDIKRIDWKISAKMNELFVKVFLQEKQMNIAFISLLCGSLHFGLKKLKQEMLCEILALLSYSAYKNHDLFNFFIWQNNNLTCDKFSKNEFFIRKNILNILNLNLINCDDNLEGLASKLTKKLYKKSLIIFIGDFWQIPNFRILSQKHEVICIVVRDFFEENPAKMGQIKVANPINLSQKNINFNQNFINLHQKKVKLFDKKLFNSFFKQGIRATKIYTHENCINKLRLFFG